jgi:hypothetical protein
MTAEEQAVVLVNEVRAERQQEIWKGVGDRRGYGIVLEALCRAIEQHEAFRQEVSGVMTYIKALYPTLPRNFNRFIIPKPKPDPLVEVLHKLGWDKDTAADLRAALEARGLTIITKEKD